MAQTRPGFPLAAPLAGALLSASALLCGCAGGAVTPLSTDLLKAPAAMVTSSVEAIASVELPAADADPVGPPTELYTRIARGATLCWFGGNGKLKATHIFHADAEPTGRGGRSEIVIHEKEPEAANPRGKHAFRVRIEPSGDTSTVSIDNLRFPAEAGQRMTADVRRWGRGDISCHDAASTKGWDAQQGPPMPDPVKPRPKARERAT